MFKKFFQRPQLNIFICSYLWLGAQKEIVRKFFKIPPAGRYFKLIGDTAELEYSDWLKSGKLILKLAKKNNYRLIHKICSQFYKKGEILLKFCQKLNQINFKKKSREELLHYLNQFSQKILQFAFSISFAQTIGPRLEEELKRVIKNHFPKVKKSDQEKILMILAQPKKEIESEKEEKELLKIVKKIQNYHLSLKNKKVLLLIESHLKKYSWLGTRWFKGNPWRKNEIIKRLKVELKRSYQKKIKEIKEKRLTQKRLISKIFKESKFTKKELALIKATQENTFLKTYRTDVINKAGFLARPLFFAIAKKLGIKYDDLLNFTFKEISKFLKEGKIDRNEVIKRRKGAIFIVTPKGEKIIFKKLKIKKKISEIKTLKGQIASPGISRGEVKIVKSKNDFKKVKSGDILVCPMTTPDYVPILKKVSAIVTDEGGITCHAAIISRELGIPCIIGTKIATKVLKDGDLVEVDADKGIARKIK